MPSPSSFVAPPGKRIAAFIYDFVLVFLTFALLAVAAEALGIDLAVWWAFVVCAFSYHCGFLLVREGRTLGKAAQDICVVGADGQPTSIGQAVVRAGVRYGPLLLLSIPSRDWVLTEALLALCAKVIAALLWLAEYSLLTSSPTRQTLADRLARTLVVNLPTWQPHRAPAIPMYSASDAEFGRPPKVPPPDRPTVRRIGVARRAPGAESALSRGTGQLCARNHLV